MKIVDIKDNRNRIFHNRYIIELIFFSVVALILLLSRSRLGVDFTDDVWYTSDPYCVAKGSIPYVNNWSQAPGFTLPIALLYWIFLKISGGTEGIIMFTRIVYCIWKTLVSLMSFVFLNRSGISIPGILLVPLIVFTPHQLFAFNYNTAGLSYGLLVFSILSLAVFEKYNRFGRRVFIISIICGILMGRCVIATPATVAVCLVIIIYLIGSKEWIMLKGFISGGIIAAFLVVLFCVIKGGINNAFIGFQYYFKDLSYVDGLKKQGITAMQQTQILWKFFLPALIIITVILVIRVIGCLSIRSFNNLIICTSSILLLISVYCLKFYDGTTLSLNESVRCGWFIPLVCLCSLMEGEIGKTLKFLGIITISYVLVYILQGYTVLGGSKSRGYWLFIPTMLGLYSIYICVTQIFDIKHIILNSLIMIIGVIASVEVIRGAYNYVYRDAPLNSLNVIADSGVWKGCYTIEQRIISNREIERYIKEKTDTNDKVYFWGNKYTRPLVLYNEGAMCSFSPLGMSSKLAFDYWHMYHTVPNKVFVNIDVDDADGRLTDANDTWVFLSKFYKLIDQKNYMLFVSEEEVIDSCIYEFVINDYEGALSFADSKASGVWRLFR